ncbi:TOB3 (member of AAA-ATPase family) [Pyrenophora seminiperda CCB06]|uniref:TOB3 (Member of AAA-ATPase family) n=1 Tax=Pyrenophora seminiperda CCB06 TaxID=1302712 RepID=A0A3M7MBV4_9PLEO|nr:TOB3 (member of AAA-ATPase family) [Pyrenophora seminiperda CCB06]
MSASYLLPLRTGEVFGGAVLIYLCFLIIELNSTQLNSNSNIGAMANPPSIQSLSDTLSTTKVPKSEAPSPGIRALYNHSTTSNPRDAKWSEFHDLILEEKHLKERGKDYPIVQRLSKVETDDGEISWVNHSIEIQSERLKALFDKVFVGYPTWYPDAAPYTFFPPFKPLVHRWAAILDAFAEVHKGDDQRLKDDIANLRGVLEPLLLNHLSAMNKARETLVVSFEQLWFFLAPGSIMFSSDQGSACALVLLQVDFTPSRSMSPAFWTLLLGQYDWNGNYCGLRRVEKIISEFKDDTLVTKFDVYPLEYAPDKEKIELELVARGEKWAQLRGMHIKNVVGKKYVLVDVGGYTREVVKPVDGRVIVDAFGYYKGQGQVIPKLSRHTMKLEPEHDRQNSSSDDLDLDSKDEEDEPRRAAGVEENVERVEELNYLLPNLCLLAPPRVRGFDLKTKEWCMFDVDDVKDTTWDEMPYQKLVLPGGDKEKELILAFSKHRASNKGFDDFVRQKGKGIIILLCGPPGVGKTLTAEAIAEKSRTPLYILSASDLGTSPADVDAALTTALECCQIWNAALLLDEADVFLECRSGLSLDRNELVSIFLRRLEYYQGLMFLTTNRLSAIDPAFQSRLDLILPYHDLTEESRKDVWKNFIGMLPKGLSSFEERDFEELAATEMNGREIKNCIKTSLVLVEDGQPLTIHQVRVVLGIRKRIVAVEKEAASVNMGYKRAASTSESPALKRTKK